MKCFLVRISTYNWLVFKLIGTNICYYNSHIRSVDIVIDFEKIKETSTY